MIVIARAYGQLCNRLFLHAHLMAAACEYQVGLANPCLGEYANLFPATAADPWCRFLPSRDEGPVSLDRSDTRTAHKVKRRIRTAKVVQSLATAYVAARPLIDWLPPARRVGTIKLCGGQRMDLDGPEFRQAVRRHDHLILQGWLFRADGLMIRHADHVREYFRLAQSRQSAIDHRMGALRPSRAHRLVGVHIRRGDYRRFENGRYFYGDETYRQAMRQTVDEAGGRPIHFFICGNESIDAAAFDEFSCTLGTGDVLDDLYGFAQCDSLIGPPSTFTQWASFIGDIPLRTIEPRPGSIADQPAPSAIHLTAPFRLKAAA